MRHSLFLFIAAVLVTVTSCNEGLTPPPEVKPGIAGAVMYEPGSPWPSTDSLQGLWLFASLEYPIDSNRVITGVLIEPRFIFLYPSLGESLPYFVDSTQFFFELPTGQYRYVGVIQQLRSDLVVSSFRIVGMLEDPTTPGSPLTVEVRRGAVVSGLRLRVDFLSPPVQPFEVAP